MGNRAVITTAYGFLCQENTVGVYLHWYGEEHQVKAFLTYCKFKEYRSPDIDSYGWARLCQVIGNYIGGGLSIDINTVSRLDTNNYDNGTYIIKGWDIVCKKFTKNPVPLEITLKEIESLILEIDKAQPIKEQLGIKKIKELIEKYIK